jgi:hypothetical protein
VLLTIAVVEVLADGTQWDAQDIQNASNSAPVISTVINLSSIEDQSLNITTACRCYYQLG